MDDETCGHQSSLHHHLIANLPSLPRKSPSWRLFQCSDKRRHPQRHVQTTKTSKSTKEQLLIWSTVDLKSRRKFPTHGSHRNHHRWCCDHPTSLDQVESCRFHWCSACFSEEPKLEMFGYRENRLKLTRGRQEEKKCGRTLAVATPPNFGHKKTRKI